MLKFDPLKNPYSSQRMTSYSDQGLVATSQPLAAQAGLRVLQEGGNAVDAAVAAAATLPVVEPTSNGIGGDAFALLWYRGKLYGLNASGPAPMDISISSLKDKGISSIPKEGWLPVTVPGVPAAWQELSSKMGRLSFQCLLEPAVEYAERGYPLSPVVAHYWNKAFQQYKEGLQGREFKEWFKTFAPAGRAPRAGERWSSKEMAETLQALAEEGSDLFYRGWLAERIAAFSAAHGGYLSTSDLSSFQPEWVEPMRVKYRGYDLWELPPNGQGLIALMAFNILEGMEVPAEGSVDGYHHQIEALKLSFHDGRRMITDPHQMKVKPRELLSVELARERRELIGEQALVPGEGKPELGGTVYLATADSEGNMVSYIQSNYMGFGSGLVVPGTGISLQNRGHLFSLDPGDANCLQPGKRTYHTIIPGFLTRDNQPLGPFGVMGGFMQPQGHLQLIIKCLDQGHNPQAALDAPRWQWMGGKKIKVEPGFPEEIARKLSERGHQIERAATTDGFGRGQVIWRLEDGVYAAGTDSRADGQVALW